jgi:hypothetical protein
VPPKFKQFSGLRMSNMGAAHVNMMMDGPQQGPQLSKVHSKGHSSHSKVHHYQVVVLGLLEGSG